MDNATFVRVFLSHFNCDRRDGAAVQSSLFHPLFTGYATRYISAGRGYDGYSKYKAAIVEDGFLAIFLRQECRRGSCVGDYYLRNDLTVWYFPYRSEGLDVFNCIGVIGRGAKEVLLRELEYPTISEEYKNILQRTLSYFL